MLALPAQQAAESIRLVSEFRAHGAAICVENDVFRRRIEANKVAGLGFSVEMSVLALGQTAWDTDAAIHWLLSNAAQ